jgi:hypothetical protein
MRNEEAARTPGEETEVVILHAVLTVLALRAKIDAQTFSRVPSLHDFVAMADTVANEIGWGDEPPDES